MQLLKVIREKEPSDKVVLVSNYTEALDILGKVSSRSIACRVATHDANSLFSKRKLEGYWQVCAGQKLHKGTDHPGGRHGGHDGHG
eukprot:scaffold63329_cov17-Tisochrysis_lutea.AAC.1